MKTGNREIPRILNFRCHFTSPNASWFGPEWLYCDIIGEHYPTNYHMSKVIPHIVADYHALPFADGSFSEVIFAPPDLAKGDRPSAEEKKAGFLDRRNWEADVRAGVFECWRVLSAPGTLIVQTPQLARGEYLLKLLDCFEPLSSFFSYDIIHCFFKDVEQGGRKIGGGRTKRGGKASRVFEEREPGGKLRRSNYRQLSFYGLLGKKED